MMVMQLDPDMSVEEIIRTAVAGDPKLLKVPKKGLMPAERKNTSRQLRQIAANIARGKPSREDREDAMHFNNLADKNDSGLLTIKEAQEITDVLEDGSVIVDIGTERWVETA